MHILNLFLSPFAKSNSYLDPGSSSMIIQMILAVVLGLGVAIRVFWKNIKGWFNRNKPVEVDQVDTSNVTEDEGLEK